MERTFQANETSAHNVKGYLLRGVNGELFFRVYNEADRSQYKDYLIHHHDLQVVITDDYSSFYEYDEKKKEDEGMDGYINYPSRVLKGGKHGMLRRQKEATKAEGQKRPDTPLSPGADP